MAYGIRRVLSKPFDEVVAKVRVALDAHGFGILSEIDVQKTLKQKLHIEHPRYLILGACNPKLAHEALHKDLSIGLFMPCNVVIYEDKKSVIVATHETTKIAELLENDELDSISAGVESLLRKVIQSV